MRTLQNAVAGIALAATFLPGAAPALDLGLGIDLQPYGRVEAGGAFTRESGGNALDGTGFGSSFGNGPLGGGALGIRLGNPADMLGVRLEAAGQYRGALGVDRDVALGSTAVRLNGDATSWWAGGGLYLDALVMDGIRAFAGGGAGLAVNKLDGLSYRLPNGASSDEGGQTRRDLGWFVSVGADFPVFDGFRASLAWRYENSGYLETTGIVVDRAFGIVSEQAPLKGRLAQHQVVISLIYGF